MSGRTIRFVATPPATGGAVGRADAATETIVLDPTWTPGPADPPDARPVRSIVAGVLRDRDPLRRSMRLLDEWAAAASAAARFDVDGMSLWYPRRLHLWRALHDRLIWRWVLGILEAGGPIERVVLDANAADLADVARLAGAAHGWAFEETEAGPTAVAARALAPARPPRRRLPWPIDPILWRLGWHPNQRAVPQALARRPAAPTDWRRVAARIGELAAGDRRPLVLTAPTTHQAIAREGATAVEDPFLGPVVAELRRLGAAPIILELGVGAAAFDPTGRPDVLPGPLLGRLYDDPADGASLAAARDRIAGRLEGPLPPLDADGLDLGPWLDATLREGVAAHLEGEIRNAIRIRRFLAALRPSALLTINEYSRPEWLAEALRAGIPVVAVQHGIIHPRHAGYIVPDRAGLPIADRTCLFGAYEARLLTGSSVYRGDEVVVTGAPRLDLVQPTPLSDADRTRIRSELGVDPAARLVVFSSTSNVASRATTIAAAFDGLLDGPWPGVHLAIKLHPAEDDGRSFYPALVEGLAAARGFAPPALSLVKEIDLFDLLRAADAHLGVSSTVLTDAVMAGTPNLIVAGLEGTDMLGYVDAGVARPVRSAADLVAALDDPAALGPDPADRAAFLADHFATGPSGPRIAVELLALVRSSAGAALG